MISRPNDSKKYVQEKCIIFGKNMRAVRRNMDMSSESLGKFLNLSTAYVGLIERGERVPSLETFLKICDFFGISSDDMLTDKTIAASASSMPASKEKTAESKLQRKQKTVSSMIHTFTMPELDFVIVMIKNFKKLCEYRRNSG